MKATQIIISAERSLNNPVVQKVDGTEGQTPAHAEEKHRSDTTKSAVIRFIINQIITIYVQCMLPNINNKK